jgi:hypothetical protein
MVSFMRDVVLGVLLLNLAACDLEVHPPHAPDGGDVGTMLHDASTEQHDASTEQRDASTELAPPSQHRAVASACPNAPVPPSSDATAPAPSCSRDDDCTTGFACACDLRCDPARAFAPASVCVPAGCRTDADCGPGGFCSLSFVPASGSCSGTLNGAVTGTFCHTPSDECTNDSDCAENAPFNLCLYGLVQHWICSGGA